MNIKKEFPILEFDNDKNRIITPEKFNDKSGKMPEKCILCFFSKAVD
jgi:hypothetical protein